MYCKCLVVLSTRVAIGHLVDEMVEWVKAPSADEASDCCFAIGRLLGSMAGKVYLHVPGDGRHVKKIAARMAQYGCVRSRRLLVDGHCPSE